MYSKKICIINHILMKHILYSLSILLYCNRIDQEKYANILQIQAIIYLFHIIYCNN